MKMEMSEVCLDYDYVVPYCRTCWFQLLVSLARAASSD